MSDYNRRDLLKLLALMAAASTFSISCRQGDRKRPRSASPEGTLPDPDREPTFFTQHEYATVTVLADLVIPADSRSPAASDVGVPAFIDGVVTDPLLGDIEERQTAMRGGLAWLDYECLTRYGNRLFLDCSREQQWELLDRIAYPENASAEDGPGVLFFNDFRDLTITGFFTSRIGVEDLRYEGNVGVREFNGCPTHVLDHVGLSPA